MKVYALSIGARRSNVVNLMSAATIARDDCEAIVAGKMIALDAFPAKDGWREHNVAYRVIPLSMVAFMIREALEGSSASEIALSYYDGSVMDTVGYEN